MTTTINDIKSERVQTVLRAIDSGDGNTLRVIAGEVKKENEDEYAESLLQLARRVEREDDQEDYKQERDDYEAECHYAPSEPY